MARVGLVQMVSSMSVAQNLSSIKQYLIQAKEQEVSLALLPENFAFMGMQDEKLSIAEAYQKGPIQEKISTLARQLNLWIIAGSIPIKTSGSKVRASCIVYDNQGKTAARYDKIHVFDVKVSEREAYEESKAFERGNEVVVVDTPIGCVGLTICYDVRFAELYHQLQIKGAKIFSIPAAFTQKTGLAHWDVLLRARAIENLAYVLAANQGGHHQNTRQTYGHSMIVDPWGSVIADKESGVGLVVGDIDVIRVEQLRAQFPSTSHHVLV
jgi:predicted amidohydrolase